MPIQDQYDKEGRFIGRIDTATGRPPVFGAGQEMDKLGDDIASFNRQVGQGGDLLQNIAASTMRGPDYTGPHQFGVKFGASGPAAQTAEQQMQALATPNDPTGYIKQEMNNFDQRVQKQNAIGTTKDTNY